MSEAKKTICEIRDYHGLYENTGKYVESDKWGASAESGPKYKALVFRCRDCGAEGTSSEMESRISERVPPPPNTRRRGDVERNANRS